MRNFITIMEDGFHSRTSLGAGYVGLTYPELWESIAEDAIPGEVKMSKTMAEALKEGPVVMEFDKSKFILESVSLQPALTAIHVNRRELSNFLDSRDLDSVFLNEDAKQQTEMMSWFLRTSPLVRDL